MVQDLSVLEVSDRLKRGDENFIVVDVREPWEIAIASVPGTLNIAMNSMPAHIGELPQDKEIAVLCHHGNRSRRVAEFLERSGFEKVYNIAGGIAAWSHSIDPTIPQY